MDPFRAVNDGDVPSLSNAIENEGLCVDAEDEYGCTLLLHALTKGHIDLALYLLQKGANIHKENALNRTPMAQLCTATASLELFRAVVDVVGVKPLNHAMSDGWTALHTLAAEKREKAPLALEKMRHVLARPDVSELFVEAGIIAALLEQAQASAKRA
jgi:ankyrin repeat protein